MKKILLGIMLVLIFLGILLYSKRPYLFYSEEKKEIINNDVRKVADFIQLSIIAELYYEKYKKYPMVEGSTPEERWHSFSSTIVAEGLFPKELPNDQRHEETGNSYNYAVDSNQQNAVIKAVLEAPDNIYVKKAVFSHPSVGGIILGLDCNKPNYCIKVPYNPQK